MIKIDYETLINGHSLYIQKVLEKDKLHTILLLFSKQIRKIRKEYHGHNAYEDIEKEFRYLAEISDIIDRNKAYRYLNKTRHRIQDLIFEIKNNNHKHRIRKNVSKSQKSYVSIVCIIKNEASYIEEWIAYYKCMGVGHIYLFDNGSTDNIKDIIKPYVASGYITFCDYHGKNAQLPLYRFMAKALRKKCRWIAFIDADEFIIPDSKNLPEYLHTKEAYQAIGINWVVYGTSGHKTRPNGLVTENYHQTFENADNLLNLRIKCIVNPKEIYDISSPHFCILRNSKYAVDEEETEITTKWMYISGSGCAFTQKNKTEHIRINHYWTKSEQELKEKCNRGYPAGNFSPVYEDIMKRLNYPQKTDWTIAEHIPKIKENLKEYM